MNKTLRFFYVLTMMVFVIFISQGAQVNLIKNGDFTDNNGPNSITHWVIGSQVTSTTTASYAPGLWALATIPAYSFRFFTSSTYYAIQTIGIVPNGQYILEAEVFPTDGLSQYKVNFYILFDGVVYQQSNFKIKKESYLGTVSMIFRVQQQKSLTIAISTPLSTTFISNVKVVAVPDSESQITTVYRTLSSEKLVPAQIPNCLTSKINQRFSVCEVCNDGFILSEDSLCVPEIPFCQKYENHNCLSCVEGYFPLNNLCIKQSPDCQKTDENGKCIQCQNGLFLIENRCFSKANLENCVEYFPYSADCEECRQGYKRNEKNVCVRQCPPDSVTDKYFLIDGKCTSLKINCAEINEDGSCFGCSNVLSEKILRKRVCQSRK